MKTATQEFQDAYADLSRSTGIDHATIQWDYWATNSTIEGVYFDLCEVLNARGKHELAREFRERVGILLPVVIPATEVPEVKMEIVRDDTSQKTKHVIEPPVPVGAVATG